MFLVVLLVVAAAADVSISTSQSLIYSNVVWRHGDRSYIMTYPNDPYKDQNIWKNGFGQLTNIGMREQYELGKFLRLTYGNLLNIEYLRDEIYIRSTDKDRTIMSAQSNLAALYPVTEDEMWNGSSTNWHPIPVHTVPELQDKLLRYPKRDCPRYNEIMAIIRASPWFIEHEKTNSDFYKFLDEKTGSKIPYNLLNVWGIEDNLFCLKSNNYALPDWATDDVLAKLMHLNSLEMGLMFTDVEYKYRNEISRMQGGVLLKQMIENMKERIGGTSNYSMIAYSAHDTTLTALLVTLGSYDWIQPQYASCVMVNLYQDGDQYTVQLQYRRGNGTVSDLDFYDCGTPCTLEKFVQISQDLIPDDYNVECRKQEATHALCDEVFVVLLLLLFTALIAVLAMIVYGKKRKSRVKYSLLGGSDTNGI